MYHSRRTHFSQEDSHAAPLGHSAISTRKIGVLVDSRRGVIENKTHFSNCIKCGDVVAMPHVIAISPRAVALRVFMGGGLASAFFIMAFRRLDKRICPSSIEFPRSVTTFHDINSGKMQGPPIVTIVRCAQLDDIRRVVTRRRHDPHTYTFATIHDRYTTLLVFCIC